MTTLAVLREARHGERRVAVVPGEISRLRALGLDVVVEAGAGRKAGFDDDSYRAQEATTVLEGRDAAVAGADLVVAVLPLQPDEVSALPEGSALISFLPPAINLHLVARLRDRKVTSFSFDLVPRTSRAQAMDALSSQASLAGYQAVLLAAGRLGRLMPMMMTAAGTSPPAKVLIMGAGVAGLQAIATAKRLGASVSAYDVRSAAAEEVRSLGATFVELPLQAAEGTGGYAAEQSEEFLARQQELIALTVGRSDVVITTAAVPGRPAPRLISTAMVDGMRPGSIIVDLAAASGGNCEITKDGEEVRHGGILVIGASDLPSQVATSASALYARNVSNLAALLVREGRVDPDFDDDIVAATCLTASGAVRHDTTSALLQGLAE
ncbi:MAG: Re/Si-specific NAD(P)(+) transhydrogenase subunit alpha [Acidimicrobiales bacterium]